MKKPAQKRLSRWFFKEYFNVHESVWRRFPPPIGPFLRAGINQRISNFEMPFHPKLAEHCARIHELFYTALFYHDATCKS